MIDDDWEYKNYSRLDTLPRILPLKYEITSKPTYNRWGEKIESRPIIKKSHSKTSKPKRDVTEPYKRVKTTKSKDSNMSKPKDVVRPYKPVKDKKEKDSNSSKPVKEKKPIPPSPEFQGFNNLNELKMYIEKSLLEIDVCYSLKEFDEDMFNFFCKMFQFHSQREKKRVEEIKDIQIKLFPKVNPNRERKTGDFQFWIIRKDDSSDSINWSSCCRRSLMRK